MTIKEIAKMAQVSSSTVSLVLNDRQGVSPATRKRVREFLDQYDIKTAYSQRQSAAKGFIRLLCYSEHGLLVKHNNGFVADIINSVEQTAAKMGYELMVMNFTKQTQAQAFASVRENPQSGTILIGTEFSPLNISELEMVKDQIVVVDNYLENYSINCVVMNNQEVVYQAIEHLVNLSHRKIGYLASAVEIENFRQRKIGFSQAMLRFNVFNDPKYTFKLTPTLEGAYNDMVKILKTKPSLPTAFFADNDSIAIGATKALREHKIFVPQQVSIIGCDDIPFCAMSQPTLTTVRTYREIIGRYAVMRVLDLAKEKHKQYIKSQIGGKLIIRESTTKNN